MLGRSASVAVPCRRYTEHRWLWRVRYFFIFFSWYKDSAQPFCSRNVECGRGICSEDGACVCHANYAGERCGFSILGAFFVE